MAIGYARKLAVIALSIRPAGGAQPTTAITQQGLSWLWDSAGGTGIPAFWRESTAGLVRLDTEVFGYLAIEDSDLHAAMTAGKRSAQVQLALDAATAQGVALPDHDGVVLVIAGIATIDGGKTVGSLGGRMLPVALFDQQGQHDFLAHEVGHVIGLEHPFRQSFTRYVNGEYGDPTCIMSAMTYGDLAPAPTRALTPVPGCGVAATSNLWSAAGPGPSPATLWRHCGEYPAAPPWVQLLPVDPKPTPVTLCAPSSTRAGTRLAVIPTGAMAPAPGYYTVEYRPAIGWDSVLSRQAGIGDTAGCAGLVVHRIVDIGTSAQYGFPRTQAVEYVDTIPIPVGGRVTWNNSTFVVRVAENAVTADGAIAVELAEYTPASVWARLTLEVVETAVTRTPDQVVTVPMMGPSCTPTQYTTEIVDTSLTLRATGLAHGLTDPSFTYAVNGIELAGATSASSPARSGTLRVQATVDVPTGYRQSERQVQWLEVRYTVTGAGAGAGGTLATVLELEPPTGLGLITFEVTITAADAEWSAESGSTVHVATRAWQLPAQAEIDRASCLRPIKDALEDATLEPGGFEIVEGVDWKDPTAQQLGRLLVGVRRLAEASPWQARELLERAADQLGVAAADLVIMRDHLASG